MGSRILESHYWHRTVREQLVEGAGLGQFHAARSQVPEVPVPYGNDSARSASGESFPKDIDNNVLTHGEAGESAV
jgi:hypothetical protein